MNNGKPEPVAQKPNITLLLIWNALIVFFVALAWGIMAFRHGGGQFSSTSFASLKYYTTLSNILSAVASGFLFVNLIRLKKGKIAEIPHFVFILKLAGSSAVGITFIVVLAFLGPVFGFGQMYIYANFFFHMLVPLMSMIEFVFFDRFDTCTWKGALLSTVFTLLYGTVYMTNLIINGRGAHGQNDFYGFALWGWPIAIAIFSAIVLAHIGIASLMRVLNRVGRKG